MDSFSISQTHGFECARVRPGRTTGIPKVTQLTHFGTQPLPPHQNSKTDSSKERNP